MDNISNYFQFLILRESPAVRFLSFVHSSCNAIATLSFPTVPPPASHRYVLDSHRGGAHYATKEEENNSLREHNKWQAVIRQLFCKRKDGRAHTVLFFKIYAVEIGHQFRAWGIIGIGQDYMSSEYAQVPTSSFGENLV